MYICITHTRPYVGCIFPALHNRITESNVNVKFTDIIKCNVYVISDNRIQRKQNRRSEPTPSMQEDINFSM